MNLLLLTLVGNCQLLGHYIRSQDLRNWGPHWARVILLFTKPNVNLLIVSFVSARSPKNVIFHEVLAKL